MAGSIGSGERASRVRGVNSIAIRTARGRHGAKITISLRAMGWLSYQDRQLIHHSPATGNPSTLARELPRPPAELRQRPCTGPLRIIRENPRLRDQPRLFGSCFAVDFRLELRNRVLQGFESLFHFLHSHACTFLSAFVPIARRFNACHCCRSLPSPPRFGPATWAARAYGRRWLGRWRWPGPRAAGQSAPRPRRERRRDDPGSRPRP